MGCFLAGGKWGQGGKQRRVTEDLQNHKYTFGLCAQQWGVIYYYLVHSYLLHSLWNPVFPLDSTSFFLLSFSSFPLMFEWEMLGQEQTHFSWGLKLMQFGVFFNTNSEYKMKNESKYWRWERNLNELQILEGWQVKQTLQNLEKYSRKIIIFKIN
jgi:hypothetical protein